MDIKQAERNIRIAWIVSAIFIPVPFLFHSLGKVIKSDLHLFMPWLFPGIIGLPELAIVSVLTFLVYRKSRIAALSLFVLYFLDRGFTYVFLYVFGTVFIIIWLCITVIWGLIFIQGIRGTFAYHRLKGAMTNKS